MSCVISPSNPISDGIPPVNELLTEVEHEIVVAIEHVYFVKIKYDKNIHESNIRQLLKWLAYRRKGYLVDQDSQYGWKWSRRSDCFLLH